MDASVVEDPDQLITTKEAQQLILAATRKSAQYKAPEQKAPAQKQQPAATAQPEAKPAETPAAAPSRAPSAPSNSRFASLSDEDRQRLLQMIS